MSWDVSTLRADHGDATTFRVEARREFVEVLVRNPRVRAKVASVILDSGKYHPSRRAETESGVAGDERLDALTELLGEGCHGGSSSGRGWVKGRNQMSMRVCFIKQSRVRRDRVSNSNH